MEEPERVCWTGGAIVVAIFALAGGIALGSCQRNRLAIQSGCAAWVANPETGAAVIDWCVCPEPE